MPACHSEDLKIQPPADVRIGLLVGTVIQQGAKLTQRLGGGGLAPASASLSVFLLHAPLPHPQDDEDYI